MREPPKSEKIVKKQKKSIFFIFFILGSKTHFLTLFQKIPFSGTPHFGTPQNEVFFQTTRKAENQKSEKVTQPSNYQTSHILMLDQTSNGCVITQGVYDTMFEMVDHSSIQKLDEQRIDKNVNHKTSLSL
jgi:hypothetical protein